MSEIPPDNAVCPTEIYRHLLVGLRSVPVGHQDDTTGSAALPELGVERELSRRTGSRFPVRLIVEVWGQLLAPAFLPLIWSEPAKRSRSVRDRNLDVGVHYKGDTAHTVPAAMTSEEWERVQHEYRPTPL